MIRHPFRKRYLALLALSTVAISLAAVGKPKVSARSSSPVAPDRAVTAAGAPDDADEEPGLAPGEQVSACPSGMVLVSGEACTAVRQECAEWLDDPSATPYARCKRFSEKVTCVGERVQLRFCIDREEYTASGDALPKGDVSWTDAKKTCEAEGKRLCEEREWTFACEGESMAPYPYGFVRDKTACNIDNEDVVDKNKGVLYDLRRPAADNPRCLSPFGVHNMVGNVDEWVVLDKPHYSKVNHGKKMSSGLKGGWWGPLRNRCRPTTVDHDEVFHELQTGFRCCADTGATQRTASAD